MKTCLKFVALLGVAVMTCLPVHAEESAPVGPVYVIPIKGMIERGLLYAFRRGMKEAERHNASALVLDMDTPGGQLQAAEEIVLLLLNAPMKTYTYVNPRAISAGAIIAMATDEIYMRPDGLIGDAMPIMMSPLPGGGAQEPSEGIREKIMSPTIALVRSAAQAKGHDEKVGEAMIRPEFEYIIGDTVISKEGELLTLTSAEAARTFGDDQKPLISLGTIDSLDEFLATLDHRGGEPVVVTITPAERIARVIDGFPFSSILLALGLLGVYIEFKTPGFGLPGIAGMLLLALWFWGHHIAGLAGYSELLLFTVGVFLIGLELFVIPGFGLTGIFGIGMLVTAVIMSMTQSAPVAPEDFKPTFVAIHTQGAIIEFGLAMLGSVLGVVLLAKVLPKTSLFQRLVLAETISARAGDQQTSQPVDTSLVGAMGMTATPLHPAGIGQIGDRRYNVVSRGEYIEVRTTFRVAAVQGNRIVVEAATDPKGSTATS
ncbi:MAG: hypothetical protein O3A51_11925 [Verrucomicrobia bacterium]|nr:hypothetical protein [Verrucomicrobiota bacterium]